VVVERHGQKSIGRVLLPVQQSLELQIEIHEDGIVVNGRNDAVAIEEHVRYGRDLREKAPTVQVVIQGPRRRPLLIASGRAFGSMLDPVH